MQNKRALASGPCFESNREPLYKRLPRSDAKGRQPADFMMLIPGLRNLAPALFDSRMASLRNILERRTEVLFVDLNLPLNLLWISVSPRSGVINELSAEIRLAIPEARLVGHPPAAAVDPPTTPGSRAALSAARRALLFWRPHRSP